MGDSQPLSCYSCTEQTTCHPRTVSHLCIYGHCLQAMQVGCADHATSDLTTVAHHQPGSRLLEPIDDCFGSPIGCIVCSAIRCAVCCTIGSTIRGCVLCNSDAGTAGLCIGLSVLKGCPRLPVIETINQEHGVARCFCMLLCLPSPMTCQLLCRCQLWG